MTLMELKDSLIKSDKLFPFYIFTGEERVILNAYVDKICKKHSGQIKKISNVKQAYKYLNSGHLLKLSKTCFIINDDKDFLSSEKLWSELLNAKILKDNIIILLFSNIDKRGKFYKQYSSNIVTFDLLNTDILTKYVLKELKSIHKEHATQLVTICENNYQRILLECDKLLHLQKALNIDINEVFTYAMDNNFIWIPPKDAIFTLVDSCLSRDIPNCYFYLDQCKHIGESNLNILSNLYTNFRALLQVQSLGYCKDICNVTGLQYYQVKQVKDKINNYTDDEITQILNLIHYCEMSVKSGTVDISDAVDYLFVNIL